MPDVQILPAAGRPTLSRDELEARLRPLQLDMSRYPLAVVGIRGYFRRAFNGGSTNRRGIYDDALFLYAPSLNLFRAFNGNTDPSVNRPRTADQQGIAVLNTGLWCAYRFDVHHGQKPYEAICQRAAPVTVTRDDNPPYADTGRFGINIHRGGNFTTSSEGCQTVPPGQWDEFIGTATQAAHQLFGDAWRERVVAYALVDDTDSNPFATTSPELVPGAAAVASGGAAVDRAQAFRLQVIRPTLKAMGYWSAAAEQLLLGTAMAESALTARVQMGGGPARGLFQMEPATHDDIWKNYLAYRQGLAAVVRSFLPSGERADAEMLTEHDTYACAMARAHYLRVSERLPDARDVDGLARYWKQHYNTAGGGGDLTHFLQACGSALDNMPELA